MASLIPGFEYDIFISYRQKDNKHDHWVTDFVDSLKGELKSTFKEEVSVYFDINPHDGILETHDVDASLKEKLKCLVFIPVISHTYCDPNSFAWEHEFKAFITQASLDRFGLKVTLHSGNVGSRVLPVRIHELDHEDREMIGNELGGTLRAIDFIYKEPGVNRPLTPADDENKNLCGTKYRNQINKTANAVKEIISSLQPEKRMNYKERSDKGEEWHTTEKQKSDNERLVKPKSKMSFRELRLLIGLIVLAIGIFAVYKIAAGETWAGKSREKSIAVLPFENIANQPEDAWLGDALADEIINQLSKINSLSVKPRTSVMRFRGSETTVQEIGKKLNVNYIIGGSYQLADEKMRINVNLVNARKNTQLWGHSYNPALGDMIQMQVDIAEQIASVLRTVLSPEEKAKIEKDPTNNAGAYMNYLSANVASHDAFYFYLTGNQFIDSLNYASNFSSAIRMYDKAIMDDPGFALAYAKRSIARSWGYHTGQLDTSHLVLCKADAEKAYEIEKDLVDARIALGFYNYYCAEDYQKALDHFTAASEIDPDNYQPPFYKAMVYRKMGEWNKSQDLIRKTIEKDPQDALALINIGNSYAYLHSYDTAITFYRKAIEVMPTWSGPYSSLIETLVLKHGNTSEARIVLDSMYLRTGVSDYFHRAMLDIYEGNYRNAINEMVSSPDDGFNAPGAKYLTIAWAYSLMNDKQMAGKYSDTALVLYKKLVIEHPESSYSYSGCGMAYAGSGNMTDAIIAGRTAVKLANDDNMSKSDAIFNLAKIYIMAGDFANATRQADYLLNNPSAFSLNLMKVDPDFKKLAESSDFKSITGKRTGI